MTALGSGPGAAPAPGQRSAAHRRSDRRARSAEKALAAVVLFLAFAVTAVLLGLQWLGNQSTAAPERTGYALVLGVHPSTVGLRAIS